MDVSSINSDLIRGNVTTIILKALIDEDRYGYDILKEIEVKSGGQYKLKQPTLYSCLKRLEKQGLISSYWGDESDTEGGRRRYYALTDAGKSFLNKMQSEYEYSRTILDSLLSEEKFDFDKSDAPFDINSLRPYTKRDNGEGNSAADNQSADVEETEKENSVSDEKTVISSSVVPPSAKTTAPPAVTNVTYPNKPMFDSFDRGASSYDEGNRHSSKSLNEMLGSIDDILYKGKEGTKTEEVKELDKQEVDEDKSAVAAPVTEDKPEVSSIETKPLKEEKPVYQPTPLEVIAQENAKETLYNKKPQPILNEEESVDELQRRDSAKRALGIGAYQEKKYEPVIEEEKEEDKDILGQINKLVEDIPSESPKKVDLFSKVPIDQQLHPEKANSQPQPLAQPSEKPLAENDPRLIFDKYNKKPEPVKKENTEANKVNIEPSPVPPASTFSFRKDKDSVVNYRDAFSSLRQSLTADGVVANSDVTDVAQKPASTIDLKTKLFSEGYKLRAYSRENTENYYSMNYIKQNRINRDCYAIMYLLICFEVLIGWLIFKERFTPIAYAAVCIAALVVPCVPFVIWTVNPEKRVRGTYNFRTSVLNRLMLYLNLLVLVCLIGFFGFGANINDGVSMVAPILVPALLLLNIPLSSVVYLILYKTKKYHIS